MRKHDSATCGNRALTRDRQLERRPLSLAPRTQPHKGDAVLLNPIACLQPNRGIGRLEPECWRPLHIGQSAARPALHMLMRLRRAVIARDTIGTLDGANTACFNQIVQRGWRRCA